VGADELAGVEALIRQLNPHARLYHTNHADIPLTSILGQGAFDLERILEADPEFLQGEVHDHECGPDCDHDHHHQHGHHDPDNGHAGLDGAVHDTSIGTVSLSGGDLDPQKFFPWIQKVTQIDGPDILRLKGIVAFKDDPERFVVQGIHMILEGDHQREWREDENRSSRLVFIGRNLDRGKLERSFAACAA